MRTILVVFMSVLTAMSVGASEIGDDGLHKPAWLQDTFKDMSDDLADATADGKRLLIIFEQKGCIYCKKMHDEVFPHPEIEALIEDHFYVVQMDLFGGVDVTDFDGTELTEAQMAKRWGVYFTPTMMFMPETVEDGQTAAQAAVITMPGAFGRITTQALLEWVRDKGYDGDEHFQKYVAKRVSELAQ
ncbi:MAG: SoxW family protein [Halocynthiibacter sp.]